MSDAQFDADLIASFFRQVAEFGWQNATLAGAARAANLSLAETRARFPSREALLLRFGRMADEAALSEAPTGSTTRDRLFELLMRRIDVLQANRDGVLKLLRALPNDPTAAMLLALGTRRSMRWMLDAAGVTTRGIAGELRAQGLVALWLCVLRAWERDESPDLSSTMAALDAALRRAEQAASWFGGGRGATADGITDDGGLTAEPPAQQLPDGPLPEAPVV